MKKIIILFSCIYTTLLQTFPISFTRLILTDHGKLIKTVDLIGDAHLKVNELVKRPSRYKKEFLLETERKLFTTAERTLLIALRELNKRPGHIDLFWEALPKGSIPREEITKHAPFLGYAGFIAAEEFDQNKGSIHFDNADSYRRMLGLNGLYTEMMLIYLSGAFSALGVTPEQLQSLAFPMADFKKDLENIITLLANLVNSIQESSATAYKNTENFWDQIKNNLQKNIIEEIINPALEKKPDIKVDEFVNGLSAEQKKFIETNINNITDLEIIFKILSSPASHVIAYAGFLHVVQVYDLLLRLGYDVVIDILPISNMSLDYWIPLSHRAWQLLLESPQKSFKRYKERQQRAWEFRDNREKQFYSFFEKLSDPTLQSTEAQNDFIKNELTPFLRKSSNRNYFNFLEGRRFDNFETILFYAVKNNLIKIVEFLISKGVRVNSINRDGKTPLHYASQLPHPDIFLLLVRNGGDITLTDNSNKTPLDYMDNAPWKEEASKLMKQKKRTAA